VSGVDEPTLDGMPEPPPAWVRPDEGVRLAGQTLDWMLAAALPHVGTDEDMPVLENIQLTVRDGILTTAATDRYTLIRERALVSQTCGDFTFLLRADDAKSLRVLLKTVLRSVDKDDRGTEPVDLAYEQTDDGPTLRVLGHDLDVRFTEADYPERFPNVGFLALSILEALDTHGRRPFDVLLNPTLLARTVALQAAGRGSSAFRFSSSGKDNAPVVVQPVDEDDDVVIIITPLKSGEPSDG
jgi:hypothetical protein